MKKRKRQGRRGPGRPPLENGEHERFTVRLSEERLARYRAAAKRAGLPLATWMKRVLDQASAGA